MEAAFDSYAAYYDESFSNTEVGKMQRNRVWALLEASGVLQECKQILEVNCGTGVDAVFFARKGHQVTATDVSPAMVHMATQKAKQENVEVQCLTVSFADLKTAFPTQKFDLVFSNFGGLNCISPTELMLFFETVNYLLKPGGSLIIVPMPSFCVWETLFYTAKGQFRNAFRRANTRTIAYINGHSLWVYYFSPAKAKQLASEWLKSSTPIPVGLFLPPSYTSGYFRKHPRFLRILNQLEIWFSKFPGLAAISDHYFLHLRKP